MGKDVWSGDGELGIISRVGGFMKSLIIGPLDLQGQTSRESIKLTEDVEEDRELSLQIKGELHDSEPARDRFLGDGVDGVSQEDVEDEELIDSREVLVCLCWEGRLGNAI
jgi:hypothetical protein